MYKYIHYPSIKNLSFLHSNVSAINSGHKLQSLEANGINIPSTPMWPRLPYHEGNHLAQCPWEGRADTSPYPGTCLTFFQKKKLQLLASSKGHFPCPWSNIQRRCWWHCSCPVGLPIYKGFSMMDCLPQAGSDTACISPFHCVSNLCPAFLKAPIFPDIRCTGGSSSDILQKHWCDISHIKLALYFLYHI